MNERDKLYLMRSIRFSKQKSAFQSFKTKDVSNFKLAFDLASYIIYLMSRQDNATFDKCLENYLRPPYETSSLLHASRAVYFSLLYKSEIIIKQVRLISPQLPS